jgi:hypothetical protein
MTNYKAFHPRRIGSLTVILLGFATGVSAQQFESIGLRALGMGGAFVAVADDSTAVYWNPAGLATGATLSTVGEKTSGEQLNGRQGLSDSGRYIGLSTPAVGLAYYHLRRAGAVQEPEAGAADLARLESDHFGITVVQSLTTSIAIGTTVKYVRLHAARSLVFGSGNLDETLDVDLPETQADEFDLDIGLMANFAKMRLGLTARNVREPGVDTPNGRIALDRQIRAGLALLPSASFIMSFDLDITEPKGDQAGRTAAIGVERRWDKLKMAVRAGVRLNTKTWGHSVPAAGASVTVRKGSFIDAYVMGGRDGAPEGWGVGARVSS